MKRASGLWLWLFFLGVISFCGPSLGRSAESAGYYPGKLRIEKGKNLSPEERKVEARFAKYLEEHTEEAIARYREKFGKEINTDNARELSKDYAPGGIEAADAKSRNARSSWSNAVHEPASALAKEIYRRELKKAAGPNELARVIFTAGGTAAGKTSSIERVPAIAQAAAYAQIIYDTTLSSLKSAEERIGQALAAGKTVSIVYIYRDPVEALVGGALPRAERMGRTIPLEAFLGTHIGSARVVLQITKQYEGDSRVEISVIDNSRGRGKAALADLEFLRRAAAKFTPEELRAKLHQALEDAYEKGKGGKKGGISETVYQAFKGDVSTRIHRPLGSRDGQHTELQDRQERTGP